MSKKTGGSAAFASKSMFDVLQSDDHPEEEEVEEEAVEVDQVTEAKPDETVTLSKSARKRLARQTAKAAAAPPILSPGNKDEVLKSVSEKRNGDSSSIKSSNGDGNSNSNGSISGSDADNSRPPSEIIKDVATDAKTKVQEKAGEVKEIVTETIESNKPKPPSSKSSSSKEPASPSPAPAASTGKPAELKSQASSSSASSSKQPSSYAAAAAAPPAAPSAQPPSSPSFKPSLPESLPAPSVNQLPANRKRKTPQDFTPTGPGTPNSPAKNGVTFEDGVAPGQGREGERTIPKKKNQNVIERTVWTFIMIFGFIGLLCAGHPYMILLVLACQMLVYKEVTALFDLRDHGGHQPKADEEKDKWSKSLNWYFFVVANYFLYGESIIYYFKHIVFVDAYFIPFARNHRFISFMLYTVGFVGFVANLQRQHLRQQFALFCWVHISLFLIVVSSHFIVNNILEGLVWFFVPASLVICNDVMAYVCGKLFGKTPLIKLSPKKTVEGFIGAFFCTLLFSLAWGTFFMRFPYMICPARDLGVNALSTITCKPNPVFVWRELQLSGPVRQVFESVLGSVPTLHYAPFQIHCLVMATFASLVAPFGGFFASGFKRAFNIKDFGHSIPGHGGMTDRMDCQFMMGIFAYTYYSSIIRIQNVSPGSILQTVVTSLTLEEQLQLLGDLKKYLSGQGVRV